MPGAFKRPPRLLRGIPGLEAESLGGAAVIDLAEFFKADGGEALSRLVGGVADPDRLAEMGDLAVDCAIGRELLDRAARIWASGRHKGEWPPLAA